MNFSVQPDDRVRIVSNGATGVVVSRTAEHVRFRFDANGRVANFCASTVEKV